MRIFRKAHAIAAAEELDIPRFEGTARRTVVKAPSDGEPNVGVSLVTFEPGARTHLHTHAGAQILEVVQGQCAIQSGDERATLEEGDIVVFDPDEPHWHGATTAGEMAHLAITFGATAWLDEAPVGSPEPS